MSRRKQLKITSMKIKGHINKTLMSSISKLMVKDLISLMRLIMVMKKPEMKYFKSSKNMLRNCQM